MTAFFEKPFLIGVIGVISAAVLAFLWLQTGRKQALYTLIAVISLTVIGVGISKSVVTEREQVEAVLRNAARAVERNDLAALMNCIHSDASAIRDQAAAEFPRYELHEVKIKSNLEIILDNAESPTEATAKFNVVVVGSERVGLVKNWRAPRYCIVSFRKEDGNWRVHSYQHDDAREGLLKRP